MIKTNNNDKVLTTRRFLAGHALSGIIARSPSWSNKKDVVREAYEWADKMLEEGQKAGIDNIFNLSSVSKNVLIT